MKLNILSLNMHKGFGPGLEGFTLFDMRDEIRKVSADLVFLQEVQGENQKLKSKIINWPENPQFEFLADSVWSHYAYGKNAVYEHGHHGNAILSKYPIVNWENINISTNRLEQRGILHATVHIPNHCEQLHLLCLHLNLLEGSRKTQVNTLIDRVRSHIPDNAPLIIAGDFNDWRKRITPILESKLQVQDSFFVVHGEHAKTFPSILPITSLDRIYTRGFESIHAEILISSPWSKLSDHLPLLTSLRFK
jgi:endonuclease/exonuclease/phosphatase family metal-dependent hydrolase